MDSYLDSWKRDGITDLMFAVMDGATKKEQHTVVREESDRASKKQKTNVTEGPKKAEKELVDRVPGLPLEPDELSEKDTKLLHLSQKLEAHKFTQQREPNRIVVLTEGDAGLSSEEKKLVAKQRGKMMDQKTVMERRTAVVNVAKKYGEKNYLYIGRANHYTGHVKSDFHNPFHLAKDATLEQRAKCLEKYEQYVRDSPYLMGQLKTLQGKRLGCWCKPLPCHGDILVKLIEEQSPFF